MRGRAGQSCGAGASADLQNGNQRVFQHARVAQQRQDTEAAAFASRRKRLLDEVAAVLLPEEAIVARGQEFAAVGNLDQQKAIRVEQVFQCVQRADRIRRVLDEITAGDEVEGSELRRLCPQAVRAFRLACQVSR